MKWHSARLNGVFISHPAAVSDRIIWSFHPDSNREQQHFPFLNIRAPLVTSSCGEVPIPFGHVRELTPHSLQTGSDWIKAEGNKS